MSKHVFIYSNKRQRSLDLAQSLREELEARGVAVDEAPGAGTDAILCIGGDGAFLHLIHDFDLPENPVLGINTGHVGFFQDMKPGQILEQVLDFLYNRSESGIRILSTLQSEIWTPDGLQIIRGLNEMVVKGRDGVNVHLNISIGESFIERFSGDGILVSSTAGSTAYNYSLGGSLVDPRLDILQVTPIAPMNNRTYRCFTSSLLLPPDQSLEVIPDNPEDSYIHLMTDGFVYEFSAVDRIRITYGEKKLKSVTLAGYDFWRKVKEKFL